MNEIRDIMAKRLGVLEVISIQYLNNFKEDYYNAREQKLSSVIRQTMEGIELAEEGSS